MAQNNKLKEVYPNGLYKIDPEELGEDRFVECADEVWNEAIKECEGCVPKKQSVDKIIKKLQKESKGKTTPDFTFRESLIEWSVKETIKMLNKQSV